MADKTGNVTRREFRVVQFLLDDGPRIRVTDRLREDIVPFDNHPKNKVEPLGRDFRTILLFEDQLDQLVEQVRNHRAAQYFDVEGFMRSLAAEDNAKAK